MEIETTETNTSDSQPPESAKTPSRQRPDRHSARLDRLAEYQASAVQKADALESNLASISSGLMGIALALDEMINEALAAAPQTLESVQRLFPAIDVHLRVTRQVDRFAQFELRSERQKREPIHLDPLKEGKGLPSISFESEDSEV